MSVFDPIQSLANWVTYGVLSLEHGSRLAESIRFFVFDSFKILVLLIVINYIMAITRYYLPLESIRDFLQSRRWFGFDYLLASVFGAMTPFCSCSSIPLFVGFLSVGIPIGVTFSFLIVSPLVNEAAVVLFLGLFGLRLTAIYVGASLAIGVVGGLALSRVPLEKYISPDILQMTGNAKVAEHENEHRKFNPSLLGEWWREGFALTKKLLPYVLVGVGLGAVIHGYVPQSFFATTLSSGAWWTVPLATLVAVPLYSNAVGVIPIMQALVDKGVMFGTALAFMMGTVGLSLPEALILKKVMKWQLLAAYFGIVTLGIILIGYLVNAVSLGF